MIERKMNILKDYLQWIIDCEEDILKTVIEKYTNEPFNKETIKQFKKVFKKGCQTAIF